MKGLFRRVSQGLELHSKLSDHAPMAHPHVEQEGERERESRRISKCMGVRVNSRGSFAVKATRYVSVDYIICARV